MLLPAAFSSKHHVHQVSSKFSLPQAILAPDSKGPLCPVCTHLSVLVAGLNGKRVVSAFQCSAPTHPLTTMVVALGCCSPKHHQPQQWQEEIPTGMCAYDGWTEGLAHGGFPSRSPISNTSFSNQPCFGARLAAGKVHPCLQSTEWVPTPLDLIPCTPHWCSPP